MTFRLTMHPALDGDCLVLTWGESTELHHIIVDLGRGATYNAIRGQLAALGNVELLVISHIDADHIAGAIPLVRETSPPFSPKRVWYNSRTHLIAARDRHTSVEPFGARQGEKLARGIVQFHWPWNNEFASEIVSTDSPEAKQPIPIAAGLTIRLLSPTDAALAALLPTWEKELANAHIRPFDPDTEDNPVGPQFEPLGGRLDIEKLAREKYVPDPTETNASAIAFIAEFNGQRVLLAADAHSETLESALAPLARLEGGRYRLHLLKVSHHGSKYNTSKAFPKLIDCTTFAVSTNGNLHHHPDPQTIARFLAADKERPKMLYFNYRQPGTETWDSATLKNIYNYECVFPVSQEDMPANGTLTIEMSLRSPA